MWGTDLCRRNSPIEGCVHGSEELEGEPLPAVLRFLMPLNQKGQERSLNWMARGKGVLCNGAGKLLRT